MEGIVYMPIKEKLTSSKSNVSKLILVVALIFIMTIIGCGTNTNSDKVQSNQGTQTQPPKENPPAVKPDNQAQTDPTKTNPRRVSNRPYTLITLSPNIIHI